MEAPKVILITHRKDIIIPALQETNIAQYILVLLSVWRKEIMEKIRELRPKAVVLDATLSAVTLDELREDLYECIGEFDIDTAVVTYGKVNPQLRGTNFIDELSLLSIYCTPD